MSAKTDVDEIREKIMKDIGLLKHYLVMRHALDDFDDINDAWSGIETFVNIALRVFAKTNPSKIRSEALTAAVHARLVGKERAR
jgi:GGDEF domain-containing protein